MIPSYSPIEGGAPNAATAYYSIVPDGVMRHSVTIRGAAPTNRAVAVVAKLQSFRELKENWDSYGAAKPSEGAISSAIRLVHSLDRAGYPVYFTAPGPNGEIVVELKQGERSLEVYFDAEGNSEFCLFDGGACVLESAPVPDTYELIAYLHR